MRILNPAKALIFITAIVLFSVVAPGTVSLAGERSVRSVPSAKIWDRAQYNSFTDILYFNGRFYCTFREGERHVYGKDGEIRIIVSDDGNEWKSIALLKKEGYDLRDPHLSTTPGGKIMVSFGGSVYYGKYNAQRMPFVSFSNESGDEFTGPINVRLDKQLKSKWNWLWRVTWNGDTGYGVVYQTNVPEGMATYLVKTVDGVNYETVTKFDLTGNPNEATARVMADGEMLVLMRRESEGASGYLGRSKYPYTEWEWKDTGFRVGGPNFIELPDGRLLIGTRKYGDFNIRSTVLLTSDRDGNVRESIKLPSGGDCSYPGMLIHDDTLWVSYYSSHESKASIYLSRIPVKNLK
ncbi:MAG TPA: hypothetical protein PLN69_05165 [bacterium]|nr:hypothetical protein [bacterium]